MFLSYYELADKGDVHLAAMRQALAKTKETGSGWPNLGPDHFAQLDNMMARIDQTNSRRRPPKQR